MPLDEIQDLAGCLELDDRQQNAAIYLLVKEYRAQRLVDQETVEALREIRTAVADLKANDIQNQLKFSFLDKLGIMVLGFVFSVCGGLAVWLIERAT